MSTFTAINDLNEEDELFPPINPNGALKMSPESTDMEDSSAVQVKQEEQSQAKTPSTPRKRGLGKSQNTPGAETPNNDQDEPPTKKSKTRSPVKKTGALGLLPASYEEASAEVKMIVRMREVEGKGWSEIKDVVEAITGATLGRSTLQMRYSRMKSNFVGFGKEDDPHLLQAKKEIEDRMEQEKWQRIAEVIEAKGGSKYPPATLQKRFKQLARSNESTTDSVQEME